MDGRSAPPAPLHRSARTRHKEDRVPAAGAQAVIGAKHAGGVPRCVLRPDVDLFAAARALQPKTINHKLNTSPLWPDLGAANPALPPLPGRRLRQPPGNRPAGMEEEAGEGERRAGEKWAEGEGEEE